MDQSRGSRGKASGVASIVPHNEIFVQPEGGWELCVCVCACVGGCGCADRETWKFTDPLWEIRPLAKAMG